MTGLHGNTYLNLALRTSDIGLHGNTYLDLALRTSDIGLHGNTYLNLALRTSDIGLQCFLYDGVESFLHIQVNMVQASCLPATLKLKRINKLSLGFQATRKN